MSLSSIRNLAYSILKKLGDDNVRDAEFTELEKCPQCDKDIFSPSFEAFTVLPCAHVFHRECVEKIFLHTQQNNCPVADCSVHTKPVEESFSQSSTTSLTSRVSSQLQISSFTEVQSSQEMYVNEIDAHLDASSKKRSNEAADIRPSKKSKKHVRPEDSNILKKLIRELSSDIRISEIKGREALDKESAREGSDTRTFFSLYLKISDAEKQNENARHELILAYYNFGEELEKQLAHYRNTEVEHEAQKKVNDEVRGQLPKEITKNSIRKKTEGARKIYDLFFRISDDKMERVVNIQRIKTFSASSIAKLSWDNIIYVATQVKNRVGAK